MSFSIMLKPSLQRGMTVTTNFLCNPYIFLPLGLLVCWVNVKIKDNQRIVSAYISIMHGTPLMLQLMVVYFGPSFYWNPDFHGL